MADALPLNSIIVWTGVTCPAGYTRFSALDGKYLNSDATYSAAAGGAASHSHVNISHTHSVSMSTPAASTGPSQSCQQHPTTHAAPNWSHTHSISGTSASENIAVSSQTVDPSFGTVVLCQRTS